MQFIHDRIVRIRAGWKACDAVRPCRAVCPTAVVAAGVCMCGVRGHLRVSAGGLTASRLSLVVSGVQEAHTVAAVSSPANRLPDVDRAVMKRWEE